MFYGKGAGPGPTASAVVGDVFMLSRDLLGRLPRALPEPLDVEVAPIEDSVAGFYLRLFAKDRPGVLARVADALGRRGISIASIHQSDEPGAAGLPIVLTTHPTSHGRFSKALEEILALPTIARRFAVMRLLGEERAA
jgi:homoserine dehydrogenase